jgi:hypothetical protein
MAHALLQLSIIFYACFMPARILCPYSYSDVNNSGISRFDNALWDDSHASFPRCSPGHSDR